MSLGRRNTVPDSAAKEPHDSKEGGTGALVELVELVERVHLPEQHWTAVVQLWCQDVEVPLCPSPGTSDDAKFRNAPRAF